MSHRWDCPTRWEAERQGERAFEYGSSRYSNPYDRAHSGWDNCREAERAWEDGHRQAERRAEEQAMKRRQEQHRAQEREWARQAEEEAYWCQQEYEYNQAMEAEYEAAMEAQYAEQCFWMEQEQLADALDVTTSPQGYDAS